MKASCLHYDIPTASNYPNPSGRLRRCGFRMTESVWVVTEDYMPHDLISDFDANGIRWGLFPFDPSANDGIVEHCRRALTSEIEEASSRNAASLASAQRKHILARESAATSRELEDADKSFAAATKSTVKRAEKLLSDLSAASKVFGIDPKSLPINSAYLSVQNLRSVAATRAHLYGQLRLDLIGTPMGAAANGDENVPAGIAADYIEERTSRDMSKVRNAFADAPATNGHIVESSAAVTTLAPPSQAVADRTTDTEARTFTVRTQRNGVRSVVSSLTDAEAADVCQFSEDTFAADLGRRFIQRRHVSALQIAWLHILANNDC